jgi:integrase
MTINEIGSSDSAAKETTLSTTLTREELYNLAWSEPMLKVAARFRETRVRGEEGSPKTKRSVRDVIMLPPVVEAMREQRKVTMGKSEYVFLNQYNRPLLPDSMSQHIWKVTLSKAGLSLVPNSMMISKQGIRLMRP